MNYYYKYLKYKKKYFELLNKKEQLGINHKKIINKEINKENNKEINKEFNKEFNKEINKEIINKEKIFNKNCFITKFHIDNIFLPF
jgi:hypothetical protein